MKIADIVDIANHPPSLSSPPPPPCLPLHWLQVLELKQQAVNPREEKNASLEMTVAAGIR